MSEERILTVGFCLECWFCRDGDYPGCRVCSKTGREVWGGHIPDSCPLPKVETKEGA